MSGFVLFGLHEATAVLNDPRIQAAEDRLADYLCRIQTRSRRLPQLNGTWFRAFDFARWESWASSADTGWGAWSVEAGWAQAWTAATLGLRARNTTFWDFTAAARLSEKLPGVLEQMARNTGGPWKGENTRGSGTWNNRTRLNSCPVKTTSLPSRRWGRNLLT